MVPGTPKTPPFLYQVLQVLFVKEIISTILYCLVSFSFNKMALIEMAIIGVITSLLLNVLVVTVLLRKGSHIRCFDLTIISLATSDILQSAIGYTVHIHSLQTDLMMKPMHCKVVGFTVTFLGLVSISHLVGLSIKRCLMLKYPLKGHIWSQQWTLSLYVIVPAWLYGFIWALLPLVGWSSYKTVEGLSHTCSIDFMSKSQNSVSYAYTLLVCGFMLPVITICCISYFIYSNLKLTYASIRSMRVTDNICRRRKQRDRRYTIMSLVLLGAFLGAWTPYASCVFVLNFHGKVNNSLLIFSSLFAKMSVLANPIILSIFMKDFRIRCKVLFMSLFDAVSMKIVGRPYSFPLFNVRYVKDDSLLRLSSKRKLAKYTDNADDGNRVITSHQK